MKSGKEVRAMIDKLMKTNEALFWWDDGKEQVCAIIDALLWVIGDDSGNPIDPDEWDKNDEEEN